MSPDFLEDNFKIKKTNLDIDYCPSVFLFVYSYVSGVKYTIFVCALSRPEPLVQALPAVASGQTFFNVKTTVLTAKRQETLQCSWTCVLSGKKRRDRSSVPPGNITGCCLSGEADFAICRLSSPVSSRLHISTNAHTHRHVHNASC